MATRTMSAGWRFSCGKFRCRCTGPRSRSVWPVAASRSRACWGGPRSTRWRTASGSVSAPSTSSSFRSPTRCPLATPWSCAPRRARSCTRVTSSWIRPPSTVGCPISPGSVRSATARAFVCCWPTRPTRTSRAGPRRSPPSATSCTTCSISTATGGLSPSVSPATSIASSRSPMPRSNTAGSWRPSACRCGATSRWPARWGCWTFPPTR